MPQVAGLLQNQGDWKQQPILRHQYPIAQLTFKAPTSPDVLVSMLRFTFPHIFVNLSPHFQAVLVWTRKSVALRCLGFPNWDFSLFCFGFLLSVVGFLFPVLESVAPQISWISRVGLFSGGRTLATRRLYCQSIWDFKIWILQKSEKQKFESQYFAAFPQQEMQKCLNSMINRHKRICQMICEEKVQCATVSSSVQSKICENKAKKRLWEESWLYQLSSRLSLLSNKGWEAGELCSAFKSWKVKVKMKSVKEKWKAENEKWKWK